MCLGVSGARTAPDYPLTLQMAVLAVVFKVGVLPLLQPRPLAMWRLGGSSAPWRSPATQDGGVQIGHIHSVSQALAGNDFAVVRRCSFGRNGSGSGGKLLRPSVNWCGSSRCGNGCGERGASKAQWPRDGLPRMGHPSRAQTRSQKRWRNAFLEQPGSRRPLSLGHLPPRRGHQAPRLHVARGQLVEYPGVQL